MYLVLLREPGSPFRHGAALRGQRRSRRRRRKIVMKKNRTPKPIEKLLHFLLPLVTFLKVNYSSCFSPPVASRAALETRGAGGRGKETRDALRRLRLPP